METCIIKDALDGGCGEVANTSGCEPDTRGFDPHHPPHFRKTPIMPRHYRLFFNQRLLICVHYVIS